MVVIIVVVETERAVVGGVKKGGGEEGGGKERGGEKGEVRVEKGRRIMTQHFFPLPPLGSSVLEPHLRVNNVCV